MEHEVVDAVVESFRQYAGRACEIAPDTPPPLAVPSAEITMLPNIPSLTLGLILCTLPLSFAQEPKGEDPAGPEIDWVADLDTARRLSAEDGRPVIAYFTYNGCVWCKRLEKACFFDADAVKLSRKLIWVKVNRDDTPEIPKKFNVSAYPSLLTLGDDDENIYRFKSYQEPPEFMQNLREALRRYRLYRDGREWMLPPTRPQNVIDNARIVTFPAPSDVVPGGMTRMGDSLWLVRRI